MSKQYLLVKTLSVGDQLVLQRVGMFASKEEAQEYVEHGEDYYLIRAEHLFWNVTIPDGKFYTGAGTTQPRTDKGKNYQAGKGK